jgi:hypothetical protein
VFEEGSGTCGDFLVAGTACGTEWEEDEVVAEDQNIEKDDQLSDELLAKLRDA